MGLNLIARDHLVIDAAYDKNTLCLVLALSKRKHFFNVDRFDFAKVKKK